jgi:hypothetical protein
MSIYTFYPCNPDGASPSFIALDLASDADALATAAVQLREHRSSAYVAIWAGERLVANLARSPVGAGPAGRPCLEPSHA